MSNSRPGMATENVEYDDIFAEFAFAVPDFSDDMLRAIHHNVPMPVAQQEPVKVEKLTVIKKARPVVHKVVVKLIHFAKRIR